MRIAALGLCWLQNPTSVPINTGASAILCLQNFQKPGSHVSGIGEIGYLLTITVCFLVSLHVSCP